MTALRDDLRDGLRLLARSPGLGIFASLAIGLGIGAPTTMFSIVRGFLRDLPFPEGERLAYVLQSDAVQSQRDVGLTAREVIEWRGSQRTLEGLAAFAVETFSVSGGGTWSERRSGARLTANALSVLRVPPMLGGTFTDQHEAPFAEPVVLIGEAVWRSRFGADPDIVGRSIRLNRAPVTIIGVMPGSFRFPFKEDLWVPLPLIVPASRSDDARTLQGFGRLREGVSWDQAGAEFAALAARSGLERRPDEPVLVTSAVPFRESQIQPSDVVLFGVMLGVVSLVLLVACANVANLLLVRAASRVQVTSVKVALGASRATIVRGVLVESGVMAVVGGLLGIGLAQAGITVFNRAVADVIPFFWMRIAIDPAVLGFSATLTTLAVFLAGLAPAVQASGVDPAAALREGGRGSTSLRLGRVTRGLVVAEVALSCALLVVAGLMIKGVVQETRGTVAIDVQNVLTARLDPIQSDAGEMGRPGIYDEVIDGLSAQPGVGAVAMASRLPGLSGMPARVMLAGGVYPRPEDAPRTNVNAVSGGFFAMFAAAPLAGRLLNAGDRPGGLRVAVVSAGFARRHYAQDAAVGQQVRIHGVGGMADTASVTIVGVAPDLGSVSRDPGASEIVYLSVTQLQPRAVTILVRTRGNPLEFVGQLRAHVAAVDPDVPVDQSASLEAQLGDARRPAKVFAALFTAFGVTGLLLAALGLYGVLSFSVRQRTREIAIRSALGARPFALMILPVRSSLGRLGLGLVFGFGVAAMLAPFMSDLLFGTNPHDLVVYAMVGLTLALTALLASLRPAVAAARVAPATTLASA
ncbi:MAG TPA: ADOP family duplicated permease [Gemmatimonadales bacterium]